MWHVSDTGRIEVRLLAQGEQAIKVARVQADRFIANIVTDLNVSLDVAAVTDELRYSFSKTRPEVTVIWRAEVPADKVDVVRAYLARLNEGSEIGAEVQGEVEDGPPDQ
jgi:hypothetical protein